MQLRRAVGESVRSQVSTFAEIDLMGMWLSGGLVAYSLITLALAMMEPSVAGVTLQSLEGVHVLALYFSQTLTLIALGTGYFESRDWKILVAAILGFGLQAWSLSNATSCCQGFLSWASGAATDYDASSIIGFVCPLIGNAILLWAYDRDFRRRRSTMAKPRVGTSRKR